MAFQVRDRKTQFRRKLSTERFIFMLVTLLRDKAAFESAKDHLTPDSFGLRHTHYAVLWSIWLDYYHHHGRLPKRAAVETDFASRVAYSAGAISQKRQQTIYKFLKGLYEVPDDELDAAQALRFLRMYLEDCHVESLRRMLDDDTQTPHDVSDYLQKETTKVASTAHLGQTSVTELYPTEWKPTGTKIFTTGSPAFDNQLGGGQSNGECYLLAGPTGSCKTTSSIQLASDAAKLFAQQHANSETDEPRRVSVLVSYEASKKELQDRILVYLAKISRKRFEQVDDWSRLSRTTDMPHEYEEYVFNLCRHAGMPIRSEYARAKEAIRFANKNLIVLDMTGNDKDFPPHRGTGDVPELVAIFEAMEREMGLKIGFVAIDYIGLMVDRYCESKGWDKERTYARLATTPRRVRESIAQRFDCPVWMLQQMNAGVNEAKPGQVPDHTNTKDCKTLAFNADFGIMIGRPTKDNIAQMAAKKHRRAPPLPSSIIRIHGDLGQILDGGDSYTVDPTTQRVVSKEQMSIVASVEDMDSVKRRMSVRSMDGPER